MQNKTLKNENGITLVALIITIIILIILASVSINAVLNSNFINLAIQGTINYAEAQTNEQGEMENLDYHLQEVISKIEENNFPSSSGNATNPPIATPDNSITIDPIKDIGKYVNYVPNEGTYNSLSTYAGYSSDQIFNTETEMKWRVFKIDNDVLYLISDRPTKTGGFNDTGCLMLKSYNGYNNGVKLLNDICSACYNNSAYSGISVRSFNIGDIEAVTTFNYEGYNNRIATYGESKTYLEKSSYYPSIWNLCERNNPLENRNSQTQWYTESGGGNENITVTQSRWMFGYTAQIADLEWVIPEYYELIMNNGSKYAPYWLSSRFVDLDENHCYFGLQRVNSANVDMNNLYYSSGKTIGSGYNAIRPLVVIPLSSCIITESENGDIFNILPKV